VIKSGLTRAVHFHHRLRVLTLTTFVGYDRQCLSRDFQVLRKRIEHEFGFAMEYVKVNTAESNGVIHGVYFPVGVDGSSVGWQVGFIPFEWLKVTWADIIVKSALEGVSVALDWLMRSVHVYVQELHFRRGIDRLVHYLVSQYFSGQSALERLSYSFGWCFRGFRTLWRKKFAYRYFLDKFACLREWNKILRSELHVLFKRFPSVLRLNYKHKVLVG
jgi:hypothetical protein